MFDPLGPARLLRHCALGVLTVLALTTLSHAQPVSDDPDWKETEVPAPPAFNTDRLLPLEMPRYVTLQFGVDPATLAITPDGIVRYVVVARSSSGATTAMYEGIRCATGEVKTYARASNSGAWTVVQDPQWRGLNDNQPSRHALALARQGVCDGRAAAASSAADIIKALKK
jgi:hypothetical protein